MNILICNTQEFNPQIGGVERVSATLAQKFTEMGHTVFFVACLKSTYSKEYKPVVEQIMLPDEKYNSDLNKEKLNSLCIDNKIDILLNQAGNILEFTKLCASTSKELNIPLVSAIHTNPMNGISAIMDYKVSAINKLSYIKAIRRMLLTPLRYRRIYKNDQLVYREVCSISDKVVLLSKGYFKELEYFTKPQNSNKIVAIANPIHLQLMLNQAVKEKIILFVGRLDFAEKRPDRLIRIWEKLHKDYPEWVLKLAGDGPIKEQLISYVNKRKISNVQFLGFCDSSEHYKSASILCSTSTIEGLPMVLIEGISYGCIPVSFDSYMSIYDIIEDNKSGFIIKSFSLSDYEEKLRLLMDNSVLRERMSKKAVKSSHKFEPNSIASEWISLFEELKGRVTNE